MKTIIVFIGLKVVEIAGIVFIPYWFGLWNFLGFELVFGNCLEIWMVGMLNLLLPLLIILIIVLILYANWKWAKDLTR